MNKRILEARKGLNLTRRKVAEEMHLAENYVYMVESGRHSVSDKFLYNFCERYGVNLDWIKTGEGEMYKPVTREQEVAEIAASVFKADQTDMRFQLQKLVSQLSQEEIEVLTGIAVRIADAKEKTLR